MKLNQLLKNDFHKLLELDDVLMWGDIRIKCHLNEQISAYEDLSQSVLTVIALAEECQDLAPDFVVTINDKRYQIYRQEIYAQVFYRFYLREVRDLGFNFDS